MEKEFDFNEFVEGVVIEAIKHSDGVRDLLEEFTSDSISDVENRIETLTEDVDGLDERLSRAEDATYGLDNFDQRLSELEDTTANFSEVEDVEKDVENLQERLAKMEKYLPILEALEKAKEKSAPRDNFGRFRSAYDLSDAAKHRKPNWNR